MVCLGTPGMCSLVNTGVHICLVGEVFSQYVLVWGYCITKRGLVLRFLAVPYRMRREAHFAEMAPQARLMLSFFLVKRRNTSVRLGNRRARKDALKPIYF